MDNLQNKLKKIFENMNKPYNFVGTCVNSFDEDGNCVIPYFSDTTDFANKEENSDTISKQDFVLNVADYSMLPSGDYEYYLTQDRNLIMAYNVNQDVHYFFGK